MNPFMGPPPPPFWGPHPETDEDLDLESEPGVDSPNTRTARMQGSLLYSWQHTNMEPENLQVEYLIKPITEGAQIQLDTKLNPN